MNLKKKIEQPLREKILINEERIRSLFNFKLDDEKTEIKEENNSIEQSNNQMKKESMEFEILSKSNINKSQYNNSSLNSKLNNDNNDNLISISISTGGNNKSLSSINNKHKNKIRQRNPTNSNFNTLKKSDNNIEQISNTINYNYNYSYNNYNNNNYNFTITTRKNKKNLIQSMGLKKNLKNNDINHNYYSNITNLSQCQPLFYPIKPKQSVNLNKMFERFDENERKKKEKIEKLKREKEEKELEQCFYKPLLNKKSLDMNKKIKDDFLTRQKNFNQKAKEKEKKIVRDLSKKKDKKYLTSRKNKESLSIITDFFNTNLKCELGNSDQKTVNINDTINKLYEWEQRRKEKIEKKREERECEKEDSGDHIPTIGKRSSSLANRRKVKKEYNDNIFERLYKEDDILKEKRELMVQLTKPSFEPNLNLARKYTFEELTEEKYVNDITHYYNNEFVNEIISYLNNNIMSPDDKNSNQDMQDDEIKQLYRQAIIDKMRKNFRMKSEEKRNPKKYHHM